MDCRWQYADGVPLQFAGSGASFDNCAFEWNSWTNLGSATPYAWTGGGTLAASGLPLPEPAPPMFNRMTFAFNGASTGLRLGPGSARVELGEFRGQLQLAGGGSSLEAGGSKSAAVRHSWFHESGQVLQEGRHFAVHLFAHTTHSQKAGPFSVARLKMDPHLHNRLASTGEAPALLVLP